MKLNSFIKLTILIPALMSSAVNAVKLSVNGNSVQQGSQFDSGDLSNSHVNVNYRFYSIIEGNSRDLGLEMLTSQPSGCNVCPAKGKEFKNPKYQFCLSQKASSDMTPLNEHNNDLPMPANVETLICGYVKNNFTCSHYPTHISNFIVGGNEVLFQSDGLQVERFMLNNSGYHEYGPSKFIITSLTPNTLIKQIEFECIPFKEHCFSISGFIDLLNWEKKGVLDGVFYEKEFKVAGVKRFKIQF